MLKRNVIKITVCAVALFAYAVGCVVSSKTGGGTLGFFFWENDGVLCLLNSFVWFAVLFLIGLSLVGFIGVLPVVYFKMYTLGFAVTSASFGGPAGLVGVLSLLPEVMLLFFIFTEMGSGAISFSLYILQRLSLLPRRREQTLLPGEKITFAEYIWGSVFVLFLSTLLVVYENTVIVLLD